MSDSPADSSRRATWVAIGAILALTLVGAALRCIGLGALPPGLHVDEAFNLLDARAVLAGWRPVFLPANAGREVLYTYLQAPILALLGESVANARLASALCGTLTIPAAAWFAWQLPVPRRATIAVLTAAYITFSYWQLHFSRYGIRAVLFPLVVTLVLTLWFRLTRPQDAAAGIAETRRAWVELFLLALTLGLAAYSHPAGRALAAIPALHAAWLWWRGDTRPAKVLAVALAGAVVVALPLTVFWWQHPWLFTGHAEEVSVVQLGPAAIAGNVARVVGLFNVAGDPARWRNLPGRPAFDLLNGLLFLMGLGLAIRAARRGADWAVLVLLWLVILVIPSIVTDAAPNFSRAIGVLPVACLLAALGLDATAAWLATRARGAPVVAGLVMVACLGVYAVSSTYDYFGRWATSPDTALAFDVDKVTLARRLDADQPPAVQAYLSFAEADHATVRASADSTPRGFDAGRGLVIPPTGTTQAEYLYRGDEASGQRELVRRLQPVTDDVDVSTDHLTPGGPAVVAYRVATQRLRDALVARPDSAPDLARFGPYIRLRDARFPARVRPGETVTVTLVWQALQPADRYLNTLVHLDTPAGTSVGNGDGPPLMRRDVGESSYSTDLWQPGETIIADYPVTIATDASAGSADLLVGWYDPDDPGARLQVDGGGANARENGTVLRVGTIEVVR